MSRLQDLRKERGFTQIKMQMLIGIDQSAYSKIERGERYLSFEQCRRVALALDTSMDYLAGLTDEKKPYPRAEQRAIQGAHCFISSVPPCKMVRYIYSVGAGFSPAPTAYDGVSSK